MVTAEEAFAAARAQFAAGERVAVGELARRLDVDRVTLYRWVGSREHLLGELVWERVARALSRSDEQGLLGPDRLAEALLGLVGGAGPSGPLAAFVEREPATALTILTTGLVHERLIDAFARIIDEERGRGTIRPAHPSRQIAEILVKTGEAVFWFDVRTGRGLDIANMRVLLDSLCPPRADY